MPLAQADERLEAWLVGIGRVDGRVREHLRELLGLRAAPRAKVDDHARLALDRLRERAREHADGGGSGGVLYPQSGHLGEQRRELRVRALPDSEAGLLVRLDEPVEAGIGRVERRHDERRVDEVVQRDPVRLLEAEGADPVEDQLARVARLLGDRCGGILAEGRRGEPQRAAIRHRHEIASRMVAELLAWSAFAGRDALDDAARDLAEHCVHEPARAGAQPALRPLDACIDRRRRRHAVEEEDLRGAGEQRRLDRLLEQRPVLGKMRADARDQREVPAHDRMLDRTRQRRIARIDRATALRIRTRSRARRGEVEVWKAHRLGEDSLQRDFTG